MMNGDTMAHSGVIYKVVPMGKEMKDFQNAKAMRELTEALQDAGVLNKYINDLIRIGRSLGIKIRSMEE